MLNIRVNGQQRELMAEIGLPDFLHKLEIDGHQIAVAHNGIVLHREDWPSIVLHDGDQLELVRMIGGGM